MIQSWKLLHGCLKIFIFWCKCLGFHSCLVHPHICKHAPIVGGEFDLEPLICKNLMATKESFANSKEWDFCVLASDCSSCFSWHQWVNNSWAAGAAAAGLSSSSSISLESRSSWPAAGRGESGWWVERQFSKKGSGAASEEKSRAHNFSDVFQEGAHKANTHRRTF